MTVNLPRLNQTGANEWSDVEDNDVVLKEAIEELQSQFAAAHDPISWYEPKAISAEQSISSLSFKLMSENGSGGTADEIPGIVVPENGLLLLGYRAAVKSSSSGAGRIAFHLGTNQLFGEAGSGVEASTSGTSESHVFSYPGGLKLGGSATVFQGTGQVLATSEGIGGFCVVFFGSGTFNGSVSVKFKSTSGSVTAKNRVLQAAALG